MRIKNDVFVYAEGGGGGANSAALHAEFRQALAEFFAKTTLGITRRPRVVPCGGRQQALKMFTTAIQQGKNALLLVDSEAQVISAHMPPMADTWQPWAHLLARDSWIQPVNAKDDDCHLMTQCTESWFLADWETVKNYFGQGFVEAALPAGSIEAIAKLDVYAALQRATSGCIPKGVYGKAAHSFRLLSLIDASKVTMASPWAKRLIDELATRKP